MRREMRWIWLGGTGLALTALQAIAVAIASAELARAAQGPGIAAGTASAFLQVAMAVIVYGACAATVLAAAVLKVTRRA